MTVQYESRTITINTRKQRKADTHAALLSAATELFLDEGYDDTTLAAIAERAGLHTQTLISHFPTKASIMVGIWQESLRVFEEEFYSRDTDALSSYRAFVEASSLRWPNEGGFVPMLHSLPAINADAEDTWFRFREVIAEGIAEDMGVDNTQDLRPTLLACMLFAGVSHTAHSWRGKRFNKEKYVASLLAIIDTARGMMNL